MGEPYPSAAWAHYYQATGGTYVPWPPFSQSQGYFHPGLLQERYYSTPQQPSYGIYQTQWNQMCQSFSHQPEQQLDTTPTSREDTRNDEDGTSNGDSYETVPMDISPNVSPVKKLVTAKTQGTSGMVPIATAFTEAPTDRKSLCKPDTSKRPQALHAMKTLKVMKFQCPDTINAQSSVFSLLEKCISCTKKLLAVAKGQGNSAVVEPCTCERKSAPSDIPQRKPQSLGMTKKALEKPLGQPHAVTKCANTERALRTDGRTTRDFKRRCRSRWEPAAVSNLRYIEVSDQLPATRTTAEPEKQKPISGPSHIQQAAYIGSQGLGNSELPRYSSKGAVSKSAQTVASGVPTVPCKISPGSSYPVKTVLPEASHKSNEKSCTVDICIGEKVKGTYIPDSEIDTSETTSINVKVDAMLGGCVEVMDGPVELPSEVEKLDEGWVLSFD